MNRATRLAAIAAALSVLASPSGAAVDSAPPERVAGALLAQVALAAEERGTAAALELARSRGVGTHAGMVRVV